MLYRAPRRAAKAGIAYVTDDRKVNGFVETMSVSSSIFVGHLATAKRLGFIASKRQSESVAQTFIERFKIRGTSPRSRVIALSDRVLVARRRTAAEFRIQDATQERIMFAAVH